MNKNQLFIAEVKTESPFGFKSQYSYDYLFDVAAEYGDWISIHTSPLFGGSYSNIKKAAAKTNKPILAKGFHRSNDEIVRCLNEGAQFVLCVDFLPDDFLIGKCLLEFSSYETFNIIWSKYPDYFYVHNSRDLKTGLPKSFQDFTLWNRKYGRNIIQASMIKDKMDIHPYAHGYIVGTHLVEFCIKK